MKKTDKLIIESYKNTMEAVAAYLGDAFEIVLHDLSNLDHSIIKIINGHHSGRKVGAPITDFALSMLDKITKNSSERYATYYSHDKFGKPVKSTTFAIFGEKDRVIALLCINFYLDSPITSLLNSFGPKTPSEFATESFISDSEELISQALEKAKTEVSLDNSLPLTQKNKEIVTSLYRLGIFKLKNAVKIISTDLQISTNTVYLHLRALQNS
jgi:predicted transcriptional regulator YheO